MEALRWLGSVGKQRIRVGIHPVGVPPYLSRVPRPVHHHKEQRIRAHVLLCWLSQLLIRIAEDAVGDRTWRRIREELELLHLGVFAGRVLQRTELTAGQQKILRALHIAEPCRFLTITPSA